MNLEKRGSMQNSSVDISILLITYNHEKLIGDALDSIFMQKTDLKLEILVGEDCSTDNTRCILKEYEEKHNKQMNVIYNSYNVGASRNLYNLLSKARGKYIAMLEGDDYWLNSNRLQILYDFMENHRNFAGVSHIRERRTFEGELTGIDPHENVIGKKVTLKEFHKGHEFSIMGCMYRNIFIQKCEMYKEAITSARNACDLVITHLVLKQGPVYVLNECLGVYRVSGAENSYCATTRQEKIDLDTIMQIRGTVMVLGNSWYYKKKISQKAFDGIMFLMKRKKYKEVQLFWEKLKIKEKIDFILFYPFNMLERILLHIK